MTSVRQEHTMGCAMSASISSVWVLVDTAKVAWPMRKAQRTQIRTNHAAKGSTCHSIDLSPAIYK
ncbi:907ed58e-2bf6-4fb6-81e7-6a22c787320b [Thermothielavioides terrestris]|uniref:907ed58e-2bf6-4fb6-81e7-6a22c787320b n=1 Tax=Thermothielavioides terrestris TaxID=2587410 RepID=A0A3S4F7E4_9PEZI|nr:907ed58e-2bf6-4fb6-81e7-6a22c787320b [Thermothielavioides terrestris]